METKIWKRVVNNIELSFKDISESNTVPYVFGELESDYYGLEKIELSPKDIVIDIGANVGMFSIYVKKKFGCNIIAFEPVLLNYNHFKENILLNGLKLEDFELHNTAIAAKEDIVKIGTPYYNTGGSSIFYNCENMQECKTERLDKYITDDCKYLKIDTEGGEYEIVPDIINKINTFLYVGIEYHKYYSSHNPKELHNLIVSNFKGKLFCQEPVA
jgi:FkbM family methyltransferase